MSRATKWLSFGLISLLAVFMLAACGGKETSGDSKGTGKDTLASIKDRDKIIFGVKTDTRLFGLKNPSSGDIEGFDIDISKQLAKDILGDEKKAEFKEVTSKTRIPMLQNGDIDAITATMTITDERKKEVDFSDVYFEAGQSLLVKKGSSIKSTEDLGKGSKVLAVKGSTSSQNIREKAPDASVLEFENYAEAFTALKAGQGDALTTDNAILYGMADENKQYQLTGETFTDEPYGIAVKKGQSGLVKKINASLKKMKADGRYEKIYKKWIKEEPAK
ncbi:MULTISPECIES: transporter substrate-binding domain-containing protein [Bacillus amyloliquefaciens group]|uniref:transporter substrate-binding domain-containing protein n=1 Tax=Bacillus TaxID=1386 RepID=UPI000EFB21DC|nr:transporter substrate-binding domain-containing protein [Bacillus velezensis]MCD7911816.1 transporter substrate-binding domain-containing protein [Bacillus velezensis]QRV08243.1 transporter substrate-binding domain-containing protein [Bacillus velezensis]TWO88366.1 transporter substrate-binding domain-containing protein [Bacillus velezensis]USY31625.1 transporter substrate-binding domain-containing protein [Bacillus velezensis]WFO86172.1 transporter substrate-binding domain-containing prote